MRYIKKRHTPQYLTQWKNERIEAGQKLYYNEFNYKPKLNDDLREDQHYICCYCQQIITHYQGDKDGGSNNERLSKKKCT